MDRMDFMALRDGLAIGADIGKQKLCSTHFDSILQTS